MQDVKKKCGDEDSKKKERHIVTWTPQEDDILREQISIHGTDNWTIITSKLKDKTTRQSRRRYTYLNSDFKKGGWSPEEDMLLCEAQKIYGNKWTEITKVVSGRTDNAVKNRFTTLCKKKAKYEALAKENATSNLNQNNKRVIFPNGFSNDGLSETAAPIKRMRRSHIIDESCNTRESKQNTTTNQQLRYPFAVLDQNIHNINNLQMQPQVSNNKVSNNAQSIKAEGSFLKKHDPKRNALVQQAELLSSLAVKVNAENSHQCLENAWKELQDFLIQNKESDNFRCELSDIDFQFEDLKDLMNSLQRCDDVNQLSWRQRDLYEDSSCSSECSIGSNLLLYAADDKTEKIPPKRDELGQDTGCGFKPSNGGEEIGVAKCEEGIHIAESFLSCDKHTNDAGFSALSSTEFSSPLQVTPLFRSLAAGIPSPKFSESERSFLLKTLGLESPSPNPSANPSQPPPCKRALYHIL